MQAAALSSIAFRTAFCLALAGAANAQASVDLLERPSPPSSADARGAQTLSTAPIDELLFDEGTDGAVWARTPSYKARFDGSGAMLIPFFGSDAPRDFPLQVRASAATRGGAPLDTHAAERATREGSSVRIDHGAFVVEYELALDALEQRFVFDELPGAGDLVLRLGFASELAAVDLGATLRFENELGRVDYGQAFALDAAGARVALDSRLVDGAIELRVPASFVDHASLPLVIDPLLAVATVSNASHQELYPDVAFDVSTDRWCIVWTDVWSVSDHDVFARLATGAYQLLSTLTIDFTSNSWTTPKIADDNEANLFLVCAAVDIAPNDGGIYGRFVVPSLAGTGTPFVIQGFCPQCDWPDVGGDSDVIYGSTVFCVVWQQQQSPTNMDIKAQLVAPNGLPVGLPFSLESGPQWHEHPYISNSKGYAINDGKALWTVTWQQRYSANDHDLWGAQVDSNGLVPHPMFPIDTSPFDDTEAMASTVLYPISYLGPRPYLVVYERDFGSDHDIEGAVMEGSTLLERVNLSAAFGPDWFKDQRIPAVDSSFQNFLVGFVERDTPSSYDANIWMGDYYWNGSHLVPCEPRKILAGSLRAETDVALYSMASAANLGDRYLAAWAYDDPATSYDIVAGLWDGCDVGSIQSFCAGDGQGPPCPCGNNGANGHGCGNSADSSGALLTWAGNASVSYDSFELRASGMPATASCVFFQGTTNTPNLPFGDGRRCVSGTVLRFPLKQSINGSASCPGAGGSPIHSFHQSLIGGDTRYYQAWYRDSASFCTSDSFNLTNALMVVWDP